MAGTLTLTGTVFVQPLPAAAAAPAAPYNVLTYNGSQLDRNSRPEMLGNLVLEAADDLIGDVSAGDRFTFGGAGSAGSLSIEIAPPTGQSWAVGEYDLSTVPGAVEATVQITKDGYTCDATQGSLYLLQVLRDQSGTISGLAARYSLTCGGALGVFTGEIRAESTVAYAAETGPAGWLDFGRQFAGYTGTPKTVTYTAKGSQPSVFGNVQLTESTVEKTFTITGDTCSGATLTYGQSCSVTITPKPAEIRGYNALMQVSVDGTAQWDIQLQQNGVDPRDVRIDPAAHDYGTLEVDTDATQVFTVSAVGVEPVTVTGTAITNGRDYFEIVADTCHLKTVAPNGSCSISVRARPIGDGPAVGQLEVTDDSATRTHTVDLRVTGHVSADGTYVKMGPIRLLDTRSGLGAPKARVAAGGVVHLQVAGTAGVPSTGVSAVVLNVTVTGPTASGFVSLYPTGSARPTVSSLNFTAGWTGANLVTVALGRDGQVDLYNNTGTTDLIADLVGFYNGPVAGKPVYIGGGYQPMDSPFRALDTRTKVGKVPGGAAIHVPVDFGDVGNAEVTSLAVNVTVVSPDRSGFFTTWDGTAARPTASTLNYTAGATVSNAAIVPVAVCEVCTGTAHDKPAIAVYTSATAHVIVDVVGFYDDSSFGDGFRFHPVNPVRIADSRIGQGTPHALGAGQTVSIKPPVSLAGPKTRGLVMNVTAIAPTKPTFLTVWRHGNARPGVSSVNATAGAIVPNAVITELVSGGSFDVYNLNGTTNICVDVVGTFAYYGYALNPGLLAPGKTAATAPVPLPQQPAPVIRPVA